MQRYKIESNSQPVSIILQVFLSCVSPCKDTKLKAIHNHLTNQILQNLLCFTMQRYKIESNSQLTMPTFIAPECCVSPCKDTKLKAIHNYKTVPCPLFKLCFTMQRYKIESNSQPRMVFLFQSMGCVSPCKDTKLKAIHNEISRDS